MQLLVFFAYTVQELIQCLESFELPQDYQAWSILAENHYQDFLVSQSQPYRCCIVADTLPALAKEIHWMIKGIRQSLITGDVWKTPSGSFFNPIVLTNNRVAFVYPGNGSAYPGIGYHMLQKFPVVKEAFFNLMGASAVEVMQTQLIFPNGQQPTINNYAQAEKELNDNFYKVSSASLSFSWMYTYLLRKIYGIQPEFAFGYSIGEMAMLLSLGVWQNPLQIYKNIMQSPVFFERITGEMSAVRDYWYAQGLQFPSQTIWKNIIINCSNVELNEVLKNIPHTYLMARNTENEFMIGGYIEEIQLLIQKSSYPILELPYSAAVHTPAISSEREAFINIFSSNAKTVATTLFSAASNDISYTVPEKIAETVTSTVEGVVDFTLLVKRDYSAGAHVFIEVGGRNVCSRWINQILKDKPHAAIPINIKGMDDYAAILKALSMLIGYGVTLNKTKNI